MHVWIPLQTFGIPRSAWPRGAFLPGIPHSKRVGKENRNKLELPTPTFSLVMREIMLSMPAWKGQIMTGWDLFVKTPHFVQTGCRQFPLTHKHLVLTLTPYHHKQPIEFNSNLFDYFACMH